MGRMVDGSWLMGRGFGGRGWGFNMDRQDGMREVKNSRIQKSESRIQNGGAERFYHEGSKGTKGGWRGSGMVDGSWLMGRGFGVRGWGVNCDL